MKTTQDVIKDFYKSILVVITRNSSKNYGLIIFQHMEKKLIKDFPFLDLIKISDHNVKIDSKINNIDTKEIRKIFTKIMEILGPDILKLLIKEHLDSEDMRYLNQIGVKL